MKKISLVFLVCLIIVAIFLLGFSYDPAVQPKEYYEVYLEGKLLGTIKSEKELNNYIQKQGLAIKENVFKYKNYLEAIDIFLDIKSKFPSNLPNKDIAYNFISNKSKYHISDIDLDLLTDYVDNKLYNLSELEILEMRDYVDKNEIYLSTDEVLTPTGTKIKKVYTYDTDIVSTESMYNKLVSNQTFSVPGYRFVIKNTNNEDKNIIVYTADKKIFNDAIEKLIGIFVDENEYKAYKEGNQKEITTTGSRIEEIYVDQKISYKPINVSVSEKIYTDSNELSKYLLYGDSYEQKKVVVKKGDSISKIALENEISIDEFLLSNTEYNSSENLLYEGKEVVISKINPQISIVVKKYRVSDVETNFRIVEQYDSSINQGREVITQQGQKGIERVSQNVKIVNGQTAYIEPISKETIKSSIPKIITVGTKQVATIGSTSSWLWPINSYTITSYYGYRFSPISGYREKHTALDIAASHGTPIYAANNGTVEKVSRVGSYGYHVIINHGNGYWTLYAHMSRFASGMKQGLVVARGDVIGYVGRTGAATGPHLHYEIRRGCGGYGCDVDPLPYYR